MMRNFIYTDDVISGVMAAAEYKPTRCDRVFNIGREAPSSVWRMIAIFDEELNVIAKIVIWQISYSNNNRY